MSLIMKISFWERVSRREFFFFGSLLAGILIFTQGISHNMFSLSFQVCSEGSAEGAR